MYYSSEQEQDLGFDAFIAPDDFNRTAQPVDIYEVFKREYALNSNARYIYYYSDGNYPLTLTPTVSEYYRYGYTQGGTEVIVDVPLNGSAVTIFGETTSTKRWVIVYRPSTAKFSLAITVSRAEWIYCSTTIFEIKRSVSIMSLKYIHISNLNSLTGNFAGAFNVQDQTPGIGSINIPESISEIGLAAFPWIGTNKVNLPRTKNITQKIGAPGNAFPTQCTTIYNFGASTSLGSESERSQYIYLKEISVSPQNTGYASFNNCDIIYTKDLTTLYWLAPKTVRGLTLPDQLPQAQITALEAKLSANIMQGYPLYIGTQITDLTNLYLSNKSFSTIEVGVGNTVFSAENGMLRTATNLIKAGTSNTGDLIIPNVTTIEATCFLRCTGYTGNLTIPSSVTSIAADAFSGLTNLTSLTLPAGYDCAIYRNFSFANFSSDSLNTAILNLANGTVGTPKYFFISKTSLDALNVSYPNAVSNAAARYINVRTCALEYNFNGNTLDNSGNGLDGTLVGGATITNNRLNIPNSAGAYLYTPHNSLLSFGAEYFKITFDVFFNSIGTYNWILNKRDDNSVINGARAEWHVSLFSGKLYVFLRDSSQSIESYKLFTSTNSLVANTLYSIEINYIGGVFEVKINGSTISGATTVVGNYVQMRETTSRLVVGTNGWGYTIPLNGYVDNIYIYRL